jgi:hypothetical protein
MRDDSREKVTGSGRPLAVDEEAQSTRPAVPGFLAKPSGAPVYHGFQILSDVVVDGFTLGAITDFEAEPCDEGDAFVVAPDNGRAGLVWEVAAREIFAELCPMEENRWGVWAVSFPFPMTSRQNARLNLKAILPLLKPKWDEWRARLPEPQPAQNAAANESRNCASEIADSD